ncbi:MAG: hypothetical protein AAF492_30150, partial [Verrucomicrobiota bacterium]
MKQRYKTVLWGLVTAVIAGCGKAPTDLKSTRQHMDETVWKDEVLAQRYERTFIDLADRLRNSDDAYEVLKSMPFETIEIGRVERARPYDLGIRINPLSESGRVYSRDDFLARLDTLKEESYKLIQSEWHHVNFVPGNRNTPR